MLYKGWLHSYILLWTFTSRKYVYWINWQVLGYWQFSAKVFYYGLFFRYVKWTERSLDSQMDGIACRYLSFHEGTIKKVRRELLFHVLLRFNSCATSNRLAKLHYFFPSFPPGLVNKIDFRALSFTDYLLDLILL